MAGKIENLRIQAIDILSICHLRLFCSLHMQHTNVCKYGHKCTCEYTHREIDTQTHIHTKFIVQPKTSFISKIIIFNVKQIEIKQNGFYQYKFFPTSSY